MNIDYQGYSYFITQKENENKNSLIERSWYLVKNKPNDEETYSLELKKSNIFINIKKLNCKYHHTLENKILN